MKIRIVKNNKIPRKNNKIIIFLIISLFLILLFVLFFYSSLNKNSKIRISEANTNSFTGEVVSFDFQGEKLTIYENIRFRTRNISYFVNSSCSEKQKRAVKEGFDILSNRTLLRFYELSGSAQILINCNLNNTLEKLGEGGPNYIVNVTSYNVILTGNINIYSEEKCSTPITFLHELLHVFGFIHQNDNSSILYPKLSCSSDIPASVIDKINTLYLEEKLPEILVKRLDFSQNGIYFNFDIQLFNTVPKNFENIYLYLYKNGMKIDEYKLNKLYAGESTILKIENIRDNNINLTLSADNNIYSIVLI